ncbi:MAG: Hpt domain-containing protein, partial [Sulfurimonadaceae bacterium]|nr:Hpt domain-containing protein [Sulfurimonadaceae bacterium]
MSEELKLFLEDSEEQLTFMENALVAMQDNGVNEEDIGALFRAMHTIKGTAGMFGFDDVVKFTHTAESLLSEVRVGTVNLTSEMLNLFLLCKDHTETLVALASQNQEISTDIGKTNTDLITKLIALMPENANTPAVASEKPAQSSNDIQEEETQKVWHVSINLHEDFFSSGMDIITILSCLEDLGTIKKLVPFIAEIPYLDSYNPIGAYISFDIQLETTVSQDEIKEVFEFILDDLELFIFEIDNKESLRNLLQSKNDAQVYKKFLVENKLYTQQEIDVLSKKPEVKVTPEKIQSNNVETGITIADKSPKKPVEQKHFSLRVDSSKVDQLINQISEMVIANARIAQRVDQLDDTDLDEATTIMSDML